MANVIFKRGSLSNFQNNLGRDATTDRWKQFADGTIYITTDEGGNGGALYMDYLDPDTTKTDLQREQRIRIGDTVQISSTWDAFKNANKAHDAIYYIVSENILCAWDPSANNNQGGWQQINAQKLFSDYVNSFVTTLDTDGALTINQAINSRDGQSRTTSYKLINSATVAFSKDDEYTTTNSPAITAQSEVDRARLTLTEATGGGYELRIHTDSSIGPQNSDSVHKVDNMIDHNNVDYGKITMVGAGGTSIGLTEYNTGRTTGKLTITSGKEEYLEYDNAYHTLQGKWYSSLPTNADPSPSSTVYMTGAKLTPQISYGQAGHKTTVTPTGNSTGYGINNRVTTLTWDLNVYSVDQVDSLLRAVNAMTFRGGLGSNTAALPTNNIAIGDTYAITNGFIIAQEQFLPGDLIIASAEDGYPEGSNGYLPADHIQWTHVRSGDDINATYVFEGDHALNRITLERNESIHGTIEYDSNFTISQSGEGTAAIVSVGHATKSVQRTSSTIDMSATILSSPVTQNSGVVQFQQTFVTGVSIDSCGHVTGLETKSVTITDTRKGISSISNSVDIDGGGSAELISTFTLADNSTKATEHYLESSSLTFTSGTHTDTDGTTINGIAINLTWGTF